MPTYVLLSTLTSEGLKPLRSNPNRLREVNRDVEELGARVLHQWAVLGPFDFVNVVEAPDLATIAKVSVALGARGDAARTPEPRPLRGCRRSPDRAADGRVRSRALLLVALMSRVGGRRARPAQRPPGTRSTGTPAR